MDRMSVRGWLQPQPESVESSNSLLVGAAERSVERSAEPIPEPQRPAGDPPADTSLDLILESKCRTNPLSKTKKRAQLQKATALTYIPALQKAGRECEAFRLRRCATWIQTREFLETGNERIRAANFCQLGKLCPGCGAQIAVKNAMKLFEKVRELCIMAEKDIVPALLTFTVKDGDSLRERLETLRRGLGCVKRAIQDSGRGRHRVSEWAGILGAYVGIELKRGKNSRQWHPHAHALVLRERTKLFDLEAMQASWRKFCGGPANIDLQMCYSGRAMIQNGGVLTSGIEELLRKDVFEVCKYLAKHGEISPGDMVHILDVVGSARMRFTWGNLRGVSLPERAEGDPTDEAGPWRDWVGQWHWQQGYQWDLAREGGRR